MLIDDASHSCIGNTLYPCSEIEREQEVNKSEFCHSRHDAQGCATLCGFKCRLPPCSKVSGSIQRSIRRDFSTQSLFFLDQLKCYFVTDCDRPIESRKSTYTRNKRKSPMILLETANLSDRIISSSSAQLSQVAEQRSNRFFQLRAYNQSLGKSQNKNLLFSLHRESRSALTSFKQVQFMIRSRLESTAVS
jgi:hypothetical protein